MPNDATRVLLTIVLVAAAGGYIYLYVSKAKQLLEAWAAENGYELLDAEHRLFRKGPFLWSGREQAVYRIEVCDEQGSIRRGWVRCGDWWLGVFIDKVEERWDS